MNERPLYAPLQHAGPVDRLIALSEYPHSKLALIAFELERERNELLEALRAAVPIIKAWHGMDGSDDATWDIYYKHSPEMKLIREALTPRQTEQKK